MTTPAPAINVRLAELTARVDALELGGGGAALSDAIPDLVGNSGDGTAGVAVTASRGDHRHGHGEVGDSDSHTVVNDEVNGFMSKEMLVALDELIDRLVDAAIDTPGIVNLTDQYMGRGNKTFEALTVETAGVFQGLVGIVAGPVCTGDDVLIGAVVDDDIDNTIFNSVRFNGATGNAVFNAANKIYVNINSDADDPEETAKWVLGADRTGATDGTDLVEVDLAANTARIWPTLITHGARNAKVSSIDTSVTAGDEQFILADASGGAITITLPPVTGQSGRIYEVKKTDLGVNTVTLDGDGFNVEGAGTLVILTNVAVRIICDGVAWWVV